MHARTHAVIPYVGVDVAYSIETTLIDEWEVTHPGMAGIRLDMNE